jgi:3-hydroxyacyl-[acyl-carrier-protein] dehydratase
VIGPEPDLVLRPASGEGLGDRWLFAVLNFAVLNFAGPNFYIYPNRTVMPIVEFSEFETSKLIVDKEGIERLNPHRFELSLLDGILFEDLETVRAVGIHYVRPDEFWARGHFPNFPIMPGVIICESAAQLCSYVASRSKVYTSGIMALGGLDEVRFRGPVRPGDELVIMLNRQKYRNNLMIVSQFECYVNQSLVTEGVIRGVTMPG